MTDKTLQQEVEEAIKAASVREEDREPETKEPESKEPESKEPESKEPETKEPESKEPEKKPEEKEPESKEPESKEQEPKLKEDRAPSSWSPKVREQWSALPEEVRSEILRREEASVAGVRRLQEEFAPVRQFAESLTPFIQEAAKHGHNPGDYIRNVLAGERNLRNPDPQARFQALLGIADQYGIPLREAINQSAGYEILAPAQSQAGSIPPEVARELQEARQFRESFQSQTLQQQIQEFSSNPEHEFFADVREDMAALLETGQAATLKDAYEKAIWLNPDVRSVMIDRGNSNKKQEEFRRRQAAAAGASVKTGGAAEVDVETDDDDDSTEAIIRRQLKAQSGRV